jgi:hypothetical protein
MATFEGREDTPLPLPWWADKDDVLRHSCGAIEASRRLPFEIRHNLAEEPANP